MNEDFIIENGILKEYKGAGGNVVIPSSVTSIGNRAFFDCSGLTSITIPETVTSIGSCAFEGCTGLTSVTIPNSVTSIGKWTFGGCSGLASVTIPETVTSIGDRAFERCTGLTSVTIPNSVTSIGEWTFGGCSGLTSITIPESVTSIGFGAFRGCSGLSSVTIPSSVKYIGGSAFSGCSGLSSITIPSSVTSIGDIAFFNCSGLTRINVPSIEFLCSACGIGNLNHKLIYIDGTPLSAMNHITIPDSVASIRDCAFCACSSLTSVTIPSSVTYIGGSAFSGCSGLSSVTIPNSVTTIGFYAFGGCSGLSSITIPNSVTSIGDSAFEGCSGLTSITIPDSVASIGDSAFEECSDLTRINVPSIEFLCSACGIGNLDHKLIYIDGTPLSAMNHITIPDSVTSIGNSAFSDCSGLSSVTIPNSVTSIGNSAFSDCSGLTSVTLPHKLFQMDSSSFPDDTAFVNIDDILCSCSKKETKTLKYLLSLTNSQLSYSYVYLFQSGKELISRALSGLHKDTIAPFMEILAKEKCKEKHYLKVCEFALANIETIPQSELNRLYTLCLEGKASQAADTIKPYLKAETASENETLREIESFCKNKFPQVLLEKEIALSDELVSGVRYKDDDTEVPPYIVKCAVLPYMKQFLSRKDYHVEILPDCDKVAEAFEESSFHTMLHNLADHSNLLNETYYLAPWSRFGGMEACLGIKKHIREWDNWWEYGQTGRNSMDIARDILLLNESREAMVYFDKAGWLWAYASKRGLDEEVLRDTVLCEFGLSETGCKEYDIGSQVITARLADDLSVVLADADGKIVKTLPKRGSDEGKYLAAKEDLADLRKNAKAIAKTRTRKLKECFLNGSEIKAESWIGSYTKNALLNRVARLIVWEQDGTTFTMTAGGPIDADGNGYSFTSGAIKLAHPMEMDKTVVAKWQKYFTCKGLKQPFAQIWEPVIHMDSVREDRYKGCMITYGSLRSADCVTIDDWDFHNHIMISFDDLNATVDRIDYSRHNIDNGDRFEVEEVAVARKSRRSNHSIAFLDRITILDRIEKDDVTIADRLDEFTLEQITRFIETASSSGSTGCLALLLDYKNRNFQDYDPMSEFVLNL